MSQVVPDLPLASSLAKNIAMVEDLFLYKSDIVKRTFTMGGKGGRNGVLFFVEGMVDQPAVARYILEPLLCAKPEELPETPQEIAENILKTYEM